MVLVKYLTKLFVFLNNMLQILFACIKVMLVFSAVVSSITITLENYYWLTFSKWSSLVQWKTDLVFDFLVVSLCSAGCCDRRNLYKFVKLQSFVLLYVRTTICFLAFASQSGCTSLLSIPFLCTFQFHYKFTF